MVYITETLTIKYSPRKLKLHICKTELEELSTYSLYLMLSLKQASSLIYEGRAGESDTTRPFLAVTPSLSTQSFCYFHIE